MTFYRLLCGLETSLEYQLSQKNLNKLFSERIIMSCRDDCQGTSSCCTLNGKCVPFLLYNSICKQTSRLWCKPCQPGYKCCRLTGDCISTNQICWRKWVHPRVSLLHLLKNGQIPATFCLFSIFSYPNSNEKYELCKLNKLGLRTWGFRMVGVENSTGLYFFLISKAKKWKKPKVLF